MIELTARADQAGSGSRIDYLESIRGLAAVQVLLLHVLAAFAPSLVFALPWDASLAGAIHLSPLYFLYDGYSAVYIFFVLSGYVLTRSFERGRIHPFAQVTGRIVRLGLPAMAAVSVAAAVMLIYGRANVAAGQLSGAAWFGTHWNVDLSLLSVIKDGTLNAVFLGYRGLPGVAFLSPWQRAVEQSLVAPLWTLSIEFYGSMVVLLLCLCFQRSRALWWTALILGMLFTVRSAYLCFFIGHLLARFSRAEAPLSAGGRWPIVALISGIAICVIAEFWQPEWLKAFCVYPSYLLFPGQFPLVQQKTYGAILVIVGMMHMQGVRSLLSTPWLVARSKLSFPLYLVHWPILFGPVAALFVQLDRIIGLEPARLVAIVVGIGLSLAASVSFLPVDRFALDLSRALRGRKAWPAGMPRAAPVRAVPAE